MSCHPVGSSMLSQMTGILSFVKLNNIPFSVYIHLLTDTGCFHTLAIMKNAAVNNADYSL